MLRVGLVNNKIAQYFVMSKIKRVDMKKCICLLMVVFTTTICLGQAKNNSLKGKSFKERDVVFKCDSLSKVYKLDIVSYKSVSSNGIIKHFICYYGKSGLLEKEISKRVTKNIK
jgi:hypothetical protein